MAFPAAGERVFANPSMLGVLTSISYEDPDAFRQDIREARKRTDKPIGVNFSLLKEQGLLETYHEAYVRVAGIMIQGAGEIVARFRDWGMM